MSYGYFEFLTLFSIFFILVMSLIGCFFVIQSRNAVISVLNDANEFYIERRKNDDEMVNSIINNYEEWSTKLGKTMEKVSEELVVKSKALDDNAVKMIEMQNTIDALREIAGKSAAIVRESDTGAYDKFLNNFINPSESVRKLIS